MTRDQFFLFVGAPLLFIIGIIIGRRPVSDDLAMTYAFLGLLFLIPLWWGIFEEYGRRAAGIFLIGTFVLAVVIEFFSLKAGFPFGYFWYEDILGLQLFRDVPLVMPVFLSALFAGVTVLVNRLKISSGIAWITGYMLILFVFGLLIDPNGVAENLWQYRNGGVYYDVPLGAFVGWLFLGALGGFFFENQLRAEKTMLAMFALLILLTGVSFGNSLVIPGVVGLVATGGLGWIEFFKYREGPIV